MARQIGSTFTGTTWDCLTFYHNRLHGYLVRRTGGVTSKQYRKDPRYAAARDASSEFAVVSGAGKLIRSALADFIGPVKDGTMVNRLNRELVALKQLDTSHHRGQRRPDTAMTDPQANLHFRIFQFNDGATLYGMTERFPIVERRGQQLVAQNVALQTSAFPEGATHAGLTLVRTVIDFENGRFDTRSSRMAVVTGDTPADITLDLAGASACEGVELVCMQVLFFRQHDDALVQLTGRVHAMGIVFVGNAAVAEAVPGHRASCRPQAMYTGKGSSPLESGRIFCGRYRSLPSEIVHSPGIVAKPT